MPLGSPTVGEVWETTDPSGRIVRGVVADVSETILTLVSFTGNRFRVATPSMTSTWRFSQQPPATSLRCSRRGCALAGILSFTRGSTLDWVCARHLPVGVQAALTTASLLRSELANLPQQEAREEVPAVRCTSCGNPDPVEDTRVDVSGRLWMCPLCSSRWCYLIAGPTDGAALLAMLNEMRVVLTIANFTIQYIECAPPTRVQIQAELLRIGADPNVPDGVVFDGLPIRAHTSFILDNPAGVVLRAHLTGGPDTRRIPPRVAPREVGMNEGFGLSYGGSNPPIVQGSTGAPIGPMSWASNLMVQSLTQSALSSSNPDPLLAEMQPPPFVGKGSRWVHRANGEIVEISYMGKAPDEDPVVHYRKISDDHAANSFLLQKDFEQLFRPFTVDNKSVPRSEQVIEILKDEEWEHVESGEVVRIDSVDTKRNLVTVVTKERRRSEPMANFVQAKWRKIIRRTAYARLLEDD